MDFNAGMVIALAAALIFYLRLIILQRQKEKALRRGAGSAPAARPGMVIANRWFVLAGVFLLLLGAAAAAFPALPQALRDLWWLPVSLGILLMSAGIR